MASNRIKRQRTRWSNDSDSFINDTNDEPPTKIQIETNDITKSLSTSDNYSNDILHQNEQEKRSLEELTNDNSNGKPQTKIQIETNDITKDLSTSDNSNHVLQHIDPGMDHVKQIHSLEEQDKSTGTKNKIPLLTIKYQNDSIANKYNKNVLSFLKETFQNSNNVVYNISYKCAFVEVFEERLDKEISKINDESILPEKDVDKMIIIDNDESILPEKDVDKMEVIDNGESILPEKDVDEMIIIDNEESILPEKDVDEMIIIDNDESILPETDVDKMMVIDNDESILPEKDVDEMKIIDNDESILPEKDVDKMIILDDSILPEKDVDKMIIIDNGNDETVDDMICLDTTPYQLNNYSDVRYNVLSTDKNNSKNTPSNNNFSCFNCGSSGTKHNLKDCPHPKNWDRINTARKKFKDCHTVNQRYHVSDNDNSSRFASLKPGGVLSKELRRALGLNSKEIPSHVYKMRILGYPPGWYQELVTQNDTLSMFTDDHNDNTINSNDTTDAPNVIIKDSMIIEYPGFNVPLIKDMKDEYWKYKVPPIQEDQFKQNFILSLSQCNNSSSVNTINDDDKKDIIISSTVDSIDITDDDDNDERLSVEMEIIPNNDEPLSLQTDCTDTNSQEEPPSCANKKNDDNQLDNYKEDSNQESSDSFNNIDTNTSSSTLSNNDIKSTPTSHARTPLLSKVSTFRTIPEMEKFGKDMGPLIMFENLSDSVGTYNKMKGLLTKVRTSLKSIHTNPS